MRDIGHYVIYIGAKILNIMGYKKDVRYYFIWILYIFDIYRKWYVTWGILNIIYYKIDIEIRTYITWKI